MFLHYVLGFGLGFVFFILLEPYIINFFYMRNIPMFLDFMLNKKQRDKLISYIKNRYF